MIRITVIIPTLDRPAQLAACLAALVPDFPPDAETLVIDDGGAVDLTPVVQPFADPLRLRLLQVPNGGPSAARNHGLAAASGAIALFTDDDCRPRPGWVASLAGGVSLDPPRAVGGSTFNGLPDNLYSVTAQLVLLLLSRHDRARTGAELLLPSNNFAFPADALRRLGGFDVSFRTAEDRELCRRWSNAGFALARVQEAVVDHDEQMGFFSYLRKFANYGRGAAHFHSTASRPSLRHSLSFHLHLPALVLPELRGLGFFRATAIAALLCLWELANLVGYLQQRLQRSHHA